VIVAHVVGVPVEEWLAPFLVAGGGFVVALRARFPHRSRRP
jgi:hypothetical protein